MTTQDKLALVIKKEPVNDNGSIAAWLKRLFFGGDNDNMKGQPND